MDDVRTVAAATRRRAWARQWVATRATMRRLSRLGEAAGTGMAGIGVASLGASGMMRGLIEAAQEAERSALAERTWRDA